jgi:uncharacterized protein
MDKVAYFVTGAEHWRHAPSLEAITDHLEPLYLTSCGSQPRFSQPGRLSDTAPEAVAGDSYVYDPLDVSAADLEIDILPYNISAIRLLEVNDGKQLVYDSEPFDLDVDQPDTDFRVLIYLIDANGRHVLLTNDTKRARYRTSLREPRLVESPEPQLYSFDAFWFTSRLMKAGERIRLVIGPYNSIYTQKNYNSGKMVATETREDARTVTVTVESGGERGSILYLPIARQEKPR